jgi:hypothetical protein
LIGARVETTWVLRRLSAVGQGESTCTGEVPPQRYSSMPSPPAASWFSSQYIASVAKVVQPRMYPKCTRPCSRCSDPSMQGSHSSYVIVVRQNTIDDS